MTLVVVQSALTDRFEIWAWMTEHEFCKIAEYATQAEAWAAIDAMDEKTGMLFSDEALSTNN